MPVIRHYRVTQTREVKVTANNPTDAVRIATAAFENGQNQDNGVVAGPSGVWGNTSTPVRPIDINAYEES